MSLGAHCIRRVEIRQGSPSSVYFRTLLRLGHGNTSTRTPGAEIERREHLHHSTTPNRFRQDKKKKPKPLHRQEHGSTQVYKKAVQDYPGTRTRERVSDSINKGGPTASIAALIIEKIDETPHKMNT